MSTSTSTTYSPPSEWSPQTRLVVSLLLIIHLACAAVGLLAAMTPSRLVTNIHSKALGFYTQSLGLDLNYDWSTAPVYLTQGTDLDVDSILEIETPPDAQTKVDWSSPSRNTKIVLWPDVGPRGSNRSARYQRLAAYITRVATDEASASKLASLVAARAMQEQGVRQARIRVRRHLLQSIEDVDSTEELRRNAYSTNYYFAPDNDERYFEYQAQQMDDGEVVVVKITAARDVAPVRSRAGSATE